MLEQAHVARHQRRGGEAEDLPEGEVPGHHRQHRAERVEAHQALRGVGLDRLLGEEALGVLGVVVADPGALLDLGLGLDDRLAHLAGHQLGQLALAPAQQGGGPGQTPRALGEGGAAPGLEGLSGPLQTLLDSARAQLLVAGDDLFGRGVDDV